MITNNQIKSLNENELAYLYFCLDSEWREVKMPYDMSLNAMKVFRNNSIHIILNKHSSNLKDEHKNIVIDILNKLEQNY